MTIEQNATVEQPPAAERAITMSCYLVLAAVATAGLSYPTGPPNCDSAPNHSGGKGDEIVLSVQDIGDGAWNVTVSVEHKGLILKADVNGGREKPGRGYKARSFGSGECITHSDRRSKGGKSFFFRSESGEKPSITGVLVTGYSKTYSPLRST